DAADRFGLKPGDIRRVAATVVSGIEVTDIHRDGKVYDVWVWSKPKARQSVTDIKGLLIDTPKDFVHVRLDEVADGSVKPTPDGIISLGSLVGFFTILGIAARNGIMMINHFQHLERHEGETFGPGLVVRGARERLSPILMTTLATGLAIVPLVIAGNIPGNEI